MLEARGMGQEGKVRETVGRKAERKTKTAGKSAHHKRACWKAQNESNLGGCYALQ